MKNAGTDTNNHRRFKRRLPTREPAETGRLARAIYVRDIRHKVEPEHVGKYVAIDVDSGLWAMGEEPMEARNRLGDMRPEAIDVFMERVGYEAVGSIGGGAPRRTNWSKE